MRIPVRLCGVGLIILVWCGVGLPAALAADGLYGRVLAIPADAGDLVEESAKDAAMVLQTMTGQDFSVVRDTPPAEAIRLVLADAPDTPSLLADRLKGKGLEAFVLHSTGPELLWIVANSDGGLVDGLYDYLGELGCRWLLPGDAWTVIPPRTSIVLKLDRLREPAFRMRNFFGTGGFGGDSPVDPKRDLHVRWDNWKRRNLLGGDYSLSGHAGEAFNLAHKAELQAHPEYLAMIDGKRVAWSAGAKPCASNPGLVKLYVDDRVAALRRQLKTQRDWPPVFAVSVEPADGGGHCTCPECAKLGKGTISDGVFYLANQAAKAVKAEFPGYHVSLYAYNEHAAPPNFELEPNVYVAVIPYAFQRTGMSPDDLLRAWATKVPHMSIYDYWSITDWANCLPSFDYLRQGPEKIRFWHSLGVDGASLESSFSAGAIGLPFYVSSRLFWDPAADPQAVADDFYHTAFGPAFAPMKRMLERWATNFLLTSHELGLSYRDLAEARRLAAADPAVLARLSDEEAYVHYLRLWYEYQAAKPKTPERIAAARRVVVWGWRTYWSTMVHGYRMWQLIASRYERGSTLRDEFDISKPEAPGWAEITPVSAAELAALMAEGSATYHPLDIQNRTYSAELVPLSTPTGTPGGIFSKPISMACDTDFVIQAPPGLSVLPLKVRVNHHPGRENSLAAYGVDGSKIYSQVLPADGEWLDILIPTVSPGRYRLHVSDQKTMFDIRLPAGIPISTSSFLSPDLSPPVYFYVPAGLKRVALYVPGAIPVTITDGAGKVVPYTGDDLVVIEVPAGQDGQVWSLRQYKSWSPIRMLNLPQSFAFFPDTLLVPKDAIHQ